MGDKIHAMMFDFNSWCGMPSIMGSINATHISIMKFFGAYLEDYFYHKMGAIVVIQIMVDNKKCFIDLYVGLLCRVNDHCILIRFGL